MDGVQLTAKFLSDITDMCSRTTVGKVLKRIDIFDDKETLKKEVKELIYEEYRTLKALLEAHSNGVLSTRTVEFRVETEDNHC